jgi:capsular exopolysaccharide synthesis family protein
MIEQKTEENISLKDIFAQYLFHWKFIIISVIVSLIIVTIYLRYISPTYKITASLIVKDDNKGGVTDQLSAFEGLGFNLGGAASKVENEIELLKSRYLISKTVKILNLNHSYYDLNTTKKIEVYLNKPINITYLRGDSACYNKEGVIDIQRIDENTFEIEDKGIKKIYPFGKSIKTTFGDIIITPTKYQKGKLFHIRVQLTKFDKSVDEIRKSITAEQIKKESSIIELSTVAHNIEKGKLLLNEIIDQHSKKAIDDKNEITRNTLDFINERIDFITHELSNVEQNVSSFKSSNKIQDLAINSQTYLQNESLNEKMLFENNIQLKLSEFILDHLNTSKSSELLPYNIGISNTSIDNLISSLNNLILEKNKLLTRSSNNNPIVINLEQQINSLKSNLKESLTSQRYTLKIKNKELEKEKNILENKLTSVPKQEKDFREISRQQQIKETLYLFLLQKREETSISLAATISNTKVIDEAYSGNQIVFPKTKIFYLAALLLGIILPICWIYIKNLLDTKIHGRKDIEEYGLPYIGDIPFTNIADEENQVIISASSNDSTSESFRLLRTNLEFIVQKQENEAKIIFTTSTIAKEGKSFISLNLATTIALTNKKVLLIGMDLRAPKLLEYINENNKKGVTNYILDKNSSISEYILQKPKGLLIDILPSGDIPPNPAELLLNSRIKSLFEEVKKEYDYVIVDTAPVGPVTDTLLITEYSDTIIYVCRSEYLDKRTLSIPSILYNENKLPNLAVLMNGTKINKGYGYGYGYGYVYVYGYGVNFHEDKSWYLKLFSKK